MGSDSTPPEENRLFRAAAFVKAHPPLRVFLLAFSLASVVIFAGWYVFLLSVFFAFSAEKTEFLIGLCVPAVSFLLLSLCRKKKNAKRPIDREPFSALYTEEERNKRFFRLVYRKKGESFPSRHLFSASLIAVLTLPYVPLFALALFGICILLAAARVLLALHSVRDVLFGALLGIAAGGICDLLIAIF